jgi:benzoate-CoA ligase family protein
VIRIPERFNLADHLLDARVREGRGGRQALKVDDASGGTREWTYRQVQALANRFGHVLRRLGVEPEQRVIVSLADSAEFAAAIFGGLKVGAVVVMVNPRLAAAEIEALFDYLRPKLALVEGEALPAFEAAAAGRRWPRQLLTVRAPAGASHPGFEEEAAGAPDALDPEPTHRDDPAIWLFSGGTTGRPKAVVQSHASFANTTELYAKGALGYREDDLTLSVPKLFFGYATGSNLFFPFAVGAAAVLFPEHPTAEVVFEKIRRHRPTLLVNVPTLVNQMVQHPEAARQDLSCLRFATSAGEALPVPLYHRWKETFGVELLDGLGTAEMWHIFVSNLPGAVKPGTLGRVVPGFTVRICDDEGREVAAGEVGRMWVQGDSRAWGYWREMGKTRDAFRGEWFVGGDLVSRDAEGFITYHGRGDDVLKVGGKWLVPAEVEACLLRHPAVKECAVVGVTDGAGLTKPHAFVVAADNLVSAEQGLAAGDPGPALAEALKAFVREELAPYKHPREVHFVEALPRTHLGKVDRGKLRRG